jgi:hypothetical protein
MCDEFCLLHGYEHMRKRSVFDLLSYCEVCERERDQATDQAKARARVLERSTSGEALEASTRLIGEGEAG